MESFQGKYTVLDRANSCMKYITQYGKHFYIPDTTNIFGVN